MSWGLLLTFKLSNVWAVCLERNDSISIPLYLGGARGREGERGEVSILVLRT